MTSASAHPEPASQSASLPAERSRVSGWVTESRVWLWSALVLSVLFRVPALLNAGSVHSDAAVVGLQARHLLHGEWSWFLWGAGYQASFDSLIAALLFAVFGATPLALMLGPLLGHLILVACAFEVLARKLGPRLAGLCTLAVVFTPQSINAVSTLPPRQWCITAIFAGIWLMERGNDPESRWRPRWLWSAVGAFLALSALYLDLYALTFLVGLAWLALTSVLEPVFAVGPAGLSSIGPLDSGRAPYARGERVAARLVPIAVGALLGLGVFFLSRTSPVSTSAPAGMSFEHLGHNAALLWDQCLPFIASYGVYVPGARLYPDLWTPPLPFHLVQIAGAVVLGVFILFAAVAPFVPRIPWGVRRLGVFGALTTASALGGFLLSGMPSDMWAARYLAPIVWTAPFAFAPGAWWLSTHGIRRAVWPIALYVFVAAVGGWTSYGPWVDGVLPRVTDRGAAREEQDVAELLRSRGVHEAAAQYWLAYRLTFLFGEDPVVVPLSGWEDRYRPYRERFDRAPVVAYIFHPSEPRAQPGQLEAQLRAMGARYERLRVHGFTVILHDRRGGQ